MCLWLPSQLNQLAKDACVPQPMQSWLAFGIVMLTT